MDNDNPVYVFHVILGSLAIFSAMAQLTMRLYWADHYQDVVSRREETGAVAVFFVLNGVGVAEFNHPHLPITVSTILIAIGVVTRLWANHTLYLVMTEVNKEDDHAT